ncbi:PD-(D/E)XK nuclease family protein [Alicyclobacillus shizuokensis]|uniref:PD-(D/E)XK nuclease family protein n=1 Tax=Alicyclobacillus shizuokensis TaxID=392014 RepID=UPI000836D2A0|nr:PD-(D/E)XK nuclease family protein [Alicyclobacillus shizuokensis]
MQPLELTVNDLYEFKACPLRFKFMRLDKQPVKMTENDGLREAVKSTISYFYFNLAQGKLVGMEDLKQKFGSIWYERNKIYNIMYDDKVKQRKRELEAISMLASFHRQQKFHPDKVVAVNLDFRIPFGDDLYISGQIPLIRESPRGLEIAHFKVGNHKPDEFWTKTDMGLTIEAIAFESIFKQQVPSICLHYLKAGTTVYTKRTRKDYQRLYKTIRMIKKTMEEGWYYPRESYHCDKCPAKQPCMEWT